MRTKGHLALLRYAEQHAHTPRSLAELAGLTPMQVQHLMVGRRRASLTVAVALEEATDGAVTTSDWLRPASLRIV